jgi:hypothetical protein
MQRMAAAVMILIFGLVVVALVGDLVWTGQQVAAARVTSIDQTSRLEVLELLGSPAVAKVYLLQMQALQSIDQRRIAALEATVASLKIHM